MEDVSITAKWANRVLRPLTSISRRLEKHQAKLSVAAESKQREAAEHHEAPSPTVMRRELRAENPLGSDAEPEGNDPAWIPGTTLERRRARLKYSSRSENTAGTKRKRLSIHSPEAPRTLPGAIEVATPLITGKRWEMPSSAQSHGSTGPADTVIHPPPPPVFRGRNPRYKSPWQELLEQAGDEDLAHIAHNLDRVFQNFLLSTQKVKREVNPINQETRRGARSLMSMVVRRLPDFIAKEQEAQDDLDEDGDEDMCDAYFTELEAYYAPHGTGWEPLREAVRAQGINLVARMMKHNWITDSIACALIEKSRSIAPDESDLLLSTLLSTRANYPYPQALKPLASSDTPGDPILLLRKYAHHGVANRSYIFDELAKLLSRGVLPSEWMGTKPWTMWMTRATISFSKDDTDCPAASRLIEAVILSASNVRSSVAGTSWISKQKQPLQGKAVRMRATRAASTANLEDTTIVQFCPTQVTDALSNHVISLIAVLCGIHISRSRNSDDIQSMNGPKASRIIGYLHFALQQDEKSRTSVRQSDITPYQLLRRGCILLATSLVQCNDTIIKQEHTTYASISSIDSCASAITSRPDMIKELALLVQQAFRCLRADSGDEPQRVSEDIRRMVSELASAGETPTMCTFLGQVATEAAMSFAEATADPDDHVWAVEVQETVASSQAQEERDRETSEEPASSSQRNGLFRWEESIGEWVESTPAMKKTLNIAPKGRTPRMLSSPVPCIPCSTDCSSTGSDNSRESSVTASSPPPLPSKRAFEDTDASHAQPNKRPRPAPVVVIENEAVRPKRASPGTTTPNPRVESATRREILRERSANLTRRIVPTTRQVPKVVIINSHENRPSQRPVRPSPERGERQIHRTVERRRSAYPSVKTRSNVRQRSPEQAVIPCSQDSDSDDELSFL